MQFTPAPAQLTRAIVLAIVLRCLAAASTAWLFAGLTIASAIPQPSSMAVLACWAAAPSRKQYRKPRLGELSIASGAIFDPGTGHLEHWTDFKYLWGSWPGEHGRVLFRAPASLAYRRTGLKFPEVGSGQVLKAGDNPEQGVKLLDSRWRGCQTRSGSGLRLPDTAASGFFGKWLISGRPVTGVAVSAISWDSTSVRSH
jgi:hypothetical protein